jgi:L-seryl-tRNA(Ser) seleniumtransferase
MSDDHRRHLPRVDALAARLPPSVPRPLATRLAREAVAAARAALEAALRDGTAPPACTLDALTARLSATAAALLAPRLVPVLNATGVVLHTNLGRATLPALSPAALGASNLEFDLASGARGSRTALLAPLLTELTGAEAAVAVNNATAALMLAVAAAASQGDRAPEIVVSRGELVEIGDSFRLPDVLASAGVRLREVGTTNRTTLADYATALASRPAALLRVYPSNYQIVGFTESPPVDALAKLAASASVPLIVDVGSDPLTPLAMPPEKPSARTLVAAGADLVLFSGDKEAGGPQAGLIVGREALVAAIRRHPWMRAMRVDKLRLDALMTVLQAHLRGDGGTLPTHRMLNARREDLADRAAALRDRVDDPRLEVVTTDDAVGGGAHPQTVLAGAGLRVATPHARRLHATLRAGSPAVVARLDEASVTLALRAIPPEEDATLCALLKRALDTLQPAR